MKIKLIDQTDKPAAPRAVVAMSGGVDSTVAAYLTTQVGYDCVGATMWLFDDGGAAASDGYQAAAACGIPHHTLDFCAEFDKYVLTPFVSAYAAGQTPNPCVLCNKHIKFGSLLQAAARLGGDKLITGHYARVEFSPQKNRFLLKKAVDTVKDQSYFLYTLTQDVLSKVVFPLGTLTKQEVRQIACEQDFTAAESRESQDICFIKSGFTYADFILKKTSDRFPKGFFIDPEGCVLGEHKGIVHYTIGQRKGLGISASCPLYVTKINPEENTVTLAPEEHLYAKTLTACDINLISTPALPAPSRAHARIRYRHKEAACLVWQSAPDELKIEFDQPQRAITRGQAVVIYDGDVVVGGGMIAAAKI